MFQRPQRTEVYYDADPKRENASIIQGWLMADEREYLRVPNWDQLQYRNNKRMPWIRIYDALLDDHDYMTLSDTMQTAVTKLWLMANRFNNAIPYDPAWLQRTTGIRGQTLSAALRQGFVERFTDMPETKPFSNLGQKRGAQVAPPDPDADPDPETYKDPISSSGDPSHISNTVKGLFGSNGQGRRSDSYERGSKQSENGLSGDDWERLNGAVSRMIGEGAQPNAQEIRRKLSGRYSVGQIQASIKMHFKRQEERR